MAKEGRKIAKKDRKIALLSLYLLYLYHVWNSRGVLSQNLNFAEKKVGKPCSNTVATIQL